MSDKNTQQQDPPKVTPGVEPKASDKSFTPPTSQEEFDRIIAARVKREREKFADYDELKVKAAEHDAAIEAAKTEEQKRADELAAIQKENAELKLDRDRRQWAAEAEQEHGVSAAVLRGSTKEEIFAHAEELKQLLGSAAPGPGSTPGSVPGIGKQPSPSGTATIAEQIAAAQQAGDAALVGRLKAIQLGSLSQ